MGKGLSAVVIQTWGSIHRRKRKAEHQHKKMHTKLRSDLSNEEHKTKPTRA